MLRRSLCIAFVLAALLCAADVAGTYKGSYSGSAGASGDFSITLSESGGAWKADVSFDLGGPIKTKITAVEVDGAKIKVVYQFDLQGAPLESTTIGELKGNQFE